MQKEAMQKGSKVKVEKNGVIYEGIVMPSYGDVLIIKLKNGYNVGLKIDEDLKILELTEKAGPGAVKERVRKGKKKEEEVSILGTGGTIASWVDYTTGAVHPAKSSEELLRYVPEIKRVASIKTRILFSVFSENMGAEQWQSIARCIKEELDEGSRGVVVTMGTDTMSYAASALSFMLRKISGPVIVTGSQRSTDRPSSDGFLNLWYATRAALTDLGEVVVAMHESISDDRMALHRACRVRKMHTSARDAFKSIGTKPIGWVDKDKICFNRYDKKSNKTVIDTAIDERVGMLYSYPGLSNEIFESFSENYDGIVIVGTGLGHCPVQILPGIKMAIDRGKAIAMSSQCIHGRVNMNVYSTGRKLLDAGVISCEDMLPEIAMIKLMWVLGHTRDIEKVKGLMGKEIAHEFCKRRRPNE